MWTSRFLLDPYCVAIRPMFLENFIRKNVFFGGRGDNPQPRYAASELSGSPSSTPEHNGENEVKIHIGSKYLVSKSAFVKCTPIRLFTTSKLQYLLRTGGLCWLEQEEVASIMGTDCMSAMRK